MEFDLFNRKKSLLFIFSVIIIGVGMMKITSNPASPSILPLIFLFLTILIAISTNLIVKLFFKKYARFYFENEMVNIQISDSTLMTYAKEYNVVITDFSTIKFSYIGGKNNLADLEFTFRTGEKISLSIKLEKNTNEFIEYFYHKIYTLNQNLEETKKIELLPSFYATGMALIIFKSLLMLFSILIIFLFSYHPKTSIGSIFISAAFFAQFYFIRKKNIEIFQKIKSGVSIID